MRKKILRSFSLADFAGGFSPTEAYFHRLPVLETPDLTLRPFVRQDVKDVFAFSSQEEVARYVLWEPHQNPAESREYIRSMRDLYRRGRPASWAIVHRRGGRVIGSIGVMWLSEEHRSAEIGYSLNRDYWNQGCMTQALSAVLRSLFDSLGLHRIEGQCDTRNPASGRVMEKCGMVREGVLHGRIFNKGEFIDTVLYAIVRPEQK